MATSPQAFYCLWQTEGVRERLFEFLPKADICSVRLANSACCNLVTKRLFLRTNVTFTTNTFTKQHRVQALSHIGHHIEHLTFHFPHSEATFLPPLIHPEDGREISFLYTPHTSMASVLCRPKYGNGGLGDLLTHQYPPLFHAATNVPSFINAMKHLTNMRHLTIKCPGQDPKERYRRDIVDYALISLRISIERVALNKLSKLTLSSMHPSAFNYLRTVPGFGCMPSGARRWKQIRKLYISVESWDFYGTSPGMDHLKIIDDYIRQFSPNLEKFSFAWHGRKGPCPIALSGDPLFARPRSSKKLFNEVTGPMSPLPPAPTRGRMRFPKLRYLTVRNATMNAEQLRDLVATHRDTVREFDFENVALIKGGSWEDALAPLMDQNNEHSDVWSRHSVGENSLAQPESIPLPPTPSAEEYDISLASPSPAVSAASRELLDMDTEGLVDFLFAPEQDDYFGEMPLQEEPEEYDDLASDIAAAQEASLSFSTKLVKKRLRRRRKEHHSYDAGGSETEREKPRRMFSFRSHNSEHSSRRSDDSLRRSAEAEQKARRSRDTEHSGHTLRHTTSRSSRKHGRSRGNSSASKSSHPFSHLEPPSMITLDDDDVFRPVTPPPVPPLPLNISAPMLSPDPTPPLLQPTVYDPSRAMGIDVSCGVGVGNAAIIEEDDGITPVQRNLEAEEAHRRLAEDPEARISALAKAKQAVLQKLSKEFHRRIGKEVARGCSPEAINMLRPSPQLISAMSVKSAVPRKLFGESQMSVAQDPVNHSMGMESQSALVPLMFAR